MTDHVYTVDVDYTDRSRAADGRYNVTTRTVTVLASSDDDALLAGTQMVAAIRDAIGGMPLGSRIVSVVL